MTALSEKFRGIPASEGIVIASAYVLLENDAPIEENHDMTVDDELARLQGAILRSMEELQTLYETTLAKIGPSHAQIFTAHKLILEDPEFAGAVETFIRERHVNAEFALWNVSKGLVDVFETMEDEYMRQRASDIRDLSKRVLEHLQGVNRSELASLQNPVILVAHDLAPSDTVTLDRQVVQAFVTEIGGRTSHSAIMARSMGIPAVVGLGAVSQAIQPGTTVIVDGFAGEIIIDPTDDEIRDYKTRIAHDVARKQQLQTLVHASTTTQDGHTVELAANIGSPKDLPGVLACGAEGIGLFRSEFLYMNRPTMPTEEEQFDAYRQVVQGMAGQPVIIRTLDVGGDKEIPYLDLPKEDNPFLGYRAIRVCLDRTDLFKTQLRAILRASHFGQVKLMFPMISTIEEIRQAKAILEDVKRELDGDGLPYADKLEVGIMVEIPASAIAADLFAKEVDFFSIGTNDLIQYTMACDRMNERISHLYQPYHPAILRLVNMVIKAAHAQGKWVGMCGEMAGDVVALPILLGLGLDEFSMSASSVLEVRRIVRELDYAAAQSIAERALQQDSQEAVQALVAASWTPRPQRIT